MGASASKTAAQATGAAARQYPNRTSQAFNAANAARSNPAAPPPPPPIEPVAKQGPTVKPPPRASATRDAGINLDASDPDLSRHLRSIGPVQANPTLSQTSTFRPNSAVSYPTSAKVRTNPAVLVLEARARLQEQADQEFANAGREGRHFLDAYTIRQIFEQRDVHKRAPQQIEQMLSLKPGTVASLGPPGMNGLVTEQGRGRKDVDLV